MYGDFLRRLGARDMTFFLFSTLQLEISFKMSVLRLSVTAWGSRYDLLCVFMITGMLAFSDHDHDHDRGDADHAYDHNHDFRLMLRCF